MQRSVFHRPYLSLIHWPDRLWKTVAWLVIVCFTVNCVTPAVVAAKTLKRDAELYSAPQKTEFDLASDALIALEETVDRMDRRLQGNFEFSWQETLAKKSHAKPPQAAKRAELAGREDDLAKNLAQLEAQQGVIQSYFAQTQADLKSHHVDASIQARAQAQSDHYSQLHDQLKALLQAIKDAKADADYQSTVAAANAFLHNHSSKPKRAKFDPDHLAFGPPKERPRQALTDPAAIRAALNLPSNSVPSSASANSTAVTVSSTAPAKTDASKTLLAAKPAVRFSNVAAGASTASIPTNLSSSEDVQITPAIQAKASALNNNALAIYQFVRNNVEYMPTYGSIQGSDYTLQTLRGNDMDQASLLIALLRAANIPAHYVYGTIQVPIDQLENWVGGVIDPMAALDLMGQGGIPTLGLTQGGVIKYAQIEHVWVEAQIAFAPGRGAITTPGSTWVPLDPSFKQYAYTQGMNLAQNVPFDAQGFVNRIQSTSTVNNSEGWVQNVDQNYINTQLTNYQTQVKNYVSAKNANATVGDVIGTKTIRQEALPLLAGSLPYKVTTTASRMDALPDTLRWRIELDLYMTQFGADDGSAAITLSDGLPALVARKISVTYDPASAADASVMQSAYDNVLTTFQPYLVNVVPALRIDGRSAAIAPVVGMGDSHTLAIKVTSPWYSRTRDYALTAGDVSVVVVDPSGISSAILNQRSSTHSLNSESDYDGLESEILYQIGLGWWAEHLTFDDATATQNSMVQYQLPSHAVAAAPITIDDLFGVPIRGSYKSRTFDNRENAVSVVAANNSSDKKRSFLLSIGSIGSGLEGNIFDQAYSVDSPVGFSTVASFKAANDAHVPLYVVTSDTVGTALPALSVSDDVKVDVSNAIDAGLRVSIPKQNVSVGNFTGVGYFVEDPTNGSGAYLISGGRNGGGATAQASVYPLPQLPNTAIIGFIAGSIVRSAGGALVVENGVITGIALPEVAASAGAAVGGILVGEAAPVIIALLLILMLLSAMLSIADKYYPPQVLRFRHYTSFAGILGIAGVYALAQIFASPNGTFGEGVYVADAADEESRGVGCPVPDPLDVVRRFQIPAPGAEDPSRATNWVEFNITRRNYYVVDSEVNSNGQREYIIRAPLIPTINPDNISWYPSKALYIGEYAFGIQITDWCIL